MFILPVASSKPLCLKCNESVTRIKCVSVKRHCETEPLKSPVRERRITEVRVQYHRSARLITRLFAAQQHANTRALTDEVRHADRWWGFRLLHTFHAFPKKCHFIIKKKNFLVEIKPLCALCSVFFYLESSP